MDGKVIAGGLVAVAIVTSAFFLHEAPVYGRGTASLAILFGSAVGFTLQRSRLCFTAAFRDLFLIRDRRAMLGLLAALAVGSVGYILLFGARVPDPSLPYDPPGAHIAPADWPTLLGGLTFGVGMTLAGGCISGQLYRLGEGSLVAPVAVTAMVPGYWMAYPLWDTAYLHGYSDGPIVWLPRLFGYAGALGVQLAVLGGAAAYLLWKFPALPPKAAVPLDLRGALARIFRNGWAPWAGGIALGAVAVAAYLRTLPLSTTSELNRLSSLGAKALSIAPAELQGMGKMPGCRPTAVAATLTPNALFVLALVAGSLCAALWAGEFKLRGGRPRTFALAAGGGLLMGFGALLGLGCTIGTFLSGVMAYSLHGWLFAAGLMGGAWLGVKILRRLA